MSRVWVHSRSCRLGVVAYTLAFLVLLRPAVNGQSATPAPGNSRTASPVVATVGEAQITEADVDNYVGRPVQLLEQKLYTLRKQALESMIDSILVQKEAAKEHVSESELIKNHVKIPPDPSPADVEQQWLNSYDSLSPMGKVIGRYQIILDVHDQARREALRAYLQQLRKENRATILLTEPTLSVHIKPSPLVIGNANARAELVVYQDYECPFCRSLEPVLRSVLDKEPLRSEVKLVVKQFPLSMHSGAFRAAVAGVCAGQQHKFPAMHDLMLTTPDHSESGLATTAAKSGLDVPQFKGCLASESAKNAVVQDMDEGRKNGIEGTPTFFLDGLRIELSGDKAEALSEALIARIARHNAAIITQR